MGWLSANPNPCDHGPPRSLSWRYCRCIYFSSVEGAEATGAQSEVKPAPLLFTFASWGVLYTCDHFTNCCCSRQDPKYRSLSTSSKVFTDVLSPYPPMLEVLRLAGFRHKDGDLTHLTLMHRWFWLGLCYRRSAMYTFPPLYRVYICIININRRSRGRIVATLGMPKFLKVNIGGLCIAIVPSWLYSWIYSCFENVSALLGLRTNRVRLYFSRVSHLSPSVK